jgi:hypothetical protein
MALKAGEIPQRMYEESKVLKNAVKVPHVVPQYAG